jgi:hypothetical protein
MIVAKGDDQSTLLAFASDAGQDLRLPGKKAEEDSMRRSYKGSLFSMMVLSLLLAVVLPATALGQGRGRGHGRGGIFGSNHNKCGKFVNCHDARDGRWDGRGPRGSRVGNILRSNRIRNRRDRDRSDWWRNRGRRVGRRVIVN